MTPQFTEFDMETMRLALKLAANGLTTTQPNPRVGCVIAKRDRVVGEGWHKQAGERHAEVLALHAAGNAAVGATVYVTLEPCSHHGRMPPCAQALIEAKVARVIYAVGDPNPQVNGAGAEMLRQAGISVQSGLLEAEATDLNVGFIKRMRFGRPWVRIKSAMSLDGRTALANGTSQWLTSDESRDDVQYWRSRSSAVVTGVGTVLADNPRLSVRKPPNITQPLRVVMDSMLRTPSNARLFEVPGDVLISTTADFTAPETIARAAALEKRGARIECMSHTPRTDLNALLARLAELEANEVQVEAGPTLSGEFVGQGLADELLIYVAPRLLGPQARPLFDLPVVEQLPEAQQFEIVESLALGCDMRLRLRPQANV
jgi:diaminohydroxyphosphoribosylaminopyrimidine deaminase / 5-amino-6-(5-phosphoribosylamino)uracil reductase